MIHELKIHKQWADAKLAGEKPFEIRRNDRGFQKGDIVRYKVIDPKTGEPWVEPGFPRLVTNENGVGKKYVSGRHPLEFCDFLITYVIEGVDGLERGYCVFADQPVTGTSAESKDILCDTVARYARVSALKPGDPPEGLCRCADLEKKRTCPYRLIKTTGDECFNPRECEWKVGRGTVV